MHFVTILTIGSGFGATTRLLTWQNPWHLRWNRLYSFYGLLRARERRWILPLLVLGFAQLQSDRPRRHI
jgi:hypothetical protein